MPSDKARRKTAAVTTPDPVAEVALVKARDILGELVDRALYDGKCTLIMRRGRASAALISMKDYERLTAA